MAVEIEGVAQHAVPAFLAGLVQASETLGAIPARLEAARVHDEAFGKLFDAAKVRDAYHQRLPASEENITEARQLINHFIAEFGGTPLELPEAAAVAVPVQGGESEAQSSAGDAEVTLHQAEPAEPAQAASGDSAETDETAASASAPGELIPQQTDASAAEDELAEPGEPAVPANTPAALIPEQAEAPTAESVPDDLAELLRGESAPPDPARPHPDPRHIIPAQGDPPTAEFIFDDLAESAPAAAVPRQSASPESVPAVSGPPVAAPPTPAPSRAGWWARLLAKLTGRDRR